MCLPVQCSVTLCPIDVNENVHIHYVLDSFFFISYIIAFLAQLNPLFGPTIKNGIAGHMRMVWSGIIDDSKSPCKFKLTFFD